MKKTKKEKKRLFVISAVIILLIISLVSSVAGDWTKIMENKSKITSLNKKYNNLLSEEEKINKYIKNSKLIVIKGASHFPYLEKKREVSLIIMAFLEGIM